MTRLNDRGRLAVLWAAVVVAVIAIALLIPTKYGFGG